MQSLLALSEGVIRKHQTSERNDRMSSQHPDPSTPDHVRVPHHQEVPFQLPDSSTPAGKNVAHRLQNELLVWLTTVDEAGVPHSLPLGFLWDEAQSNFLIYSMTEADRDHMRHIRLHPKVGLHFEMSGVDPIVLTGQASVSTDDPSSDQIPAWVEKYRDLFSQMGMTLQQAAVVAPVALRVRPLTMSVTSWTTR
jgi:PPOX class probable F420-dependent enzyme